VARARESLERGDAEMAVVTLAPFGGPTSRTEEIARLAHEAALKALKTEVPAAAQKDAISAALKTARELLDAGKAQSALASCQKALRIDRNHAEAKALKVTIDALLARAAAATRTAASRPP